MTEEQKGTEQTGDADQKTGNNAADAVVQQSGTQDAAGNQEAEGLKAGITAEREKRQAVEVELQNVRDQIALQAAQPKAEPVKQMSMSQAVAKQLGIDLDLASPEETLQVVEAMQQITTGQQAEQSFMNSHPDYAELVGVNGPGGQFQYAPPLMRALKANSALADALRTSPNKAVLAYEIASKDPQYLAEKADNAKSDETKAAEKAATKIEAANKQLSISDAKGGGGNLDQAAAVAAMSEEEFRKHNEAIMAKAI